MPPPAPEAPERPPWRLVVLWTALFAAASVIVCAPFLRLDALDATPDWGDARLISWTLAWHARWPFTGQWPLDAPFFAPEPQALAYSDPMVALGLMAAPLTAWAGPTIAFNALRLAIPVLNALATALLVWHGVRDARAAFVAGFAFAFAYSQVAVAYQGIVHLALLAGIPLTARALDRWWQSGRSARPGHGGGGGVRPGARLVVLGGAGRHRHRRPAGLAGRGHARDAVLVAAAAPWARPRRGWRRRRGAAVAARPPVPRRRLRPRATRSAACRSSRATSSPRRPTRGPGRCSPGPAPPADASWTDERAYSRRPGRRRHGRRRTGGGARLRRRPRSVVGGTPRADRGSCWRSVRLRPGGGWQLFDLLDWLPGAGVVPGAVPHGGAGDVGGGRAGWHRRAGRAGASAIGCGIVVAWCSWPPRAT